MRFDGRFLHGAPSSRRVDRDAVATTAAAADRTEASGGSRGNQEHGVVKGAAAVGVESRVTFLCNIWLHHRPVCARPCPVATVAKMSKLLAFDNSARRLALSITSAGAAAEPQSSQLAASLAVASLLQPDPHQVVTVTYEEDNIPNSTHLVEPEHVAAGCERRRLCTGVDASAENVSLETFATNDVGQNDPHVFECLMPSLASCKAGLAAGYDNFALADRSVWAREHSWLRPGVLEQADSATAGTGTGTGTGARNAESIRGASKRPRRQ